MGLHTRLAKNIPIGTLSALRMPRGCQVVERREKSNSVIQTLLIIFFVILLIGALPTWPYSTGWGYYPSGGLGLLLLVLLLVMLFRPTRTL